MIQCAQQQSKRDRRTYIGSTDVSIIMGVNPYDTLWDLWNYKKNGIQKEVSPQQKKRMDLGLILEDVILNCAANELELKIEEKQVFYQHEKYPFIGGTADAIAGDIILDAKNTHQFNKKFSTGEGGEEGLPDYYKTQLIYLMGLSGKKTAIEPVLWGGQELRYYQMSFNSNGNQFMYKLMIKKCVEFWERYIIGDEEPEKTEIFIEPVLKGAKKYADKEILNLICELKNVKQELKVLKEREDTLNDCVKNFMGECELLLNDEGNQVLSYNQVSQKRLDTEALKKQYGDALNDFYKQSFYRRLTIK